MKKEPAVTIESLLVIMNHQLEIIDTQDKTIADLQQKIDYFIRQKYTASSEKFPFNQPSLFGEDSTIEVEEDTEVETITYDRKKRGNKKTPPVSLSHIRVEHDLSEDEKVCPCGCKMKRIKD